MISSTEALLGANFWSLPDEGAAQNVLDKITIEKMNCRFVPWTAIQDVTETMFRGPPRTRDEDAEAEVIDNANSGHNLHVSGQQVLTVVQWWQRLKLLQFQKKALIAPGGGAAADHHTIRIQVMDYVKPTVLLQAALHLYLDHLADHGKASVPLIVFHLSAPRIAGFHLFPKLLDTGSQSELVKGNQKMNAVCDILAFYQRQLYPLPTRDSVT